jgi:hypothetical protein
MAEHSLAQQEFDIGFESSDIIGSVIMCSGNCPTITTQYSREGTGALRSYLNRKTSKISYRTEMTLPGGMDGEQKMTFGRDYWIGFSTMLPRNWTHLRTGGEMLAQIHGSSSSGNGDGGVPFEIRPKNGDWRIITRGQNETNKTYTLNSVYEDVGRWVDWVIYYRPSYNSNGIIKVWKDGALVVNQTGRRTAFKSNIGPYWKMGLYLPWKNRNCCDGDPVDRVVYHDAFRVASGSGASYQDVAPRGGSNYVADGGTSTSDGSTSGSCSSCGSTSSGSTEFYVEITNPKQGATVRGDVNIAVDARDPDGIRRVVFWVEQEKIGELSNPPYNFVFDSRSYAGTSSLRLKAVAFDNKGNKVRNVTRVNVE